MNYNFVTFFSVGRNLDTAQALVEAVQNVVSDQEKPNSGLLFIAPLAVVYGLNKDNG